MNHLGGAVEVERQENLIPADVLNFLSHVTQFVQSAVGTNRNQPRIDTAKVWPWNERIAKANLALNNKQNKSTVMNAAVALRALQPG